MSTTIASPAAIAAALQLPTPIGKGPATVDKQIKAIEDLSAQQIAALRPLENGTMYAAQANHGPDGGHMFGVKQPRSGAYQALPVAAQSTITHNYTPALPVMEASDHISQEV